ncbi:hypothetical protein ACVPOR_03955 [Staphylococcus aureus]
MQSISEVADVEGQDKQKAIDNVVKIIKPFNFMGPQIKAQSIKAGIKSYLIVKYCY